MHIYRGQLLMHNVRNTYIGRYNVFYIILYTQLTLQHVHHDDYAKFYYRDYLILYDIILYDKTQLAIDSYGDSPGQSSSVKSNQ